MAWRRLSRRRATTLLNLVLLALGTAALAAMLLVVSQLTNAAERHAAVADLKLVLVPIEAVWAAHSPVPHIDRIGQPGAADADRKASLVLVQYASPLGSVLLPRAFHAAGLQTASPAREAAKLFSMVQLGADGTLMLGALLMSCAAVAVCAGLMASQREQVRDIAVLRLLGASRGFTAAVVAWEAALIALLGAAAGLLLAHAAVGWIAYGLPASAPPLTGWTLHAGEGALVLAAGAVALLGAAWPAWQAQRASVADVLATR